MVTSTLQSSCRYSMDPAEETESTMSRAGCPAASMAARTSGMEFAMPVEVSLWTTITDFSRCERSARNAVSTWSGSTPLRQSHSTSSISSPKRSATPLHRVANMPLSNISTGSPGDSVLTIPASQAPVADPGYMATGPEALNSRRKRGISSSAISANFGPRWSMVGIDMAASTLSGTLVGPGTCRKWRPLPALRLENSVMVVAGFSEERSGKDTTQRRSF